MTIYEKMNIALSGWIIHKVGMIDKYRYLVIGQWSNDDEKTPYEAKDGKKYDHPTRMFCIDLQSNKIIWNTSLDGWSHGYCDGGTTRDNKVALFGSYNGITYYLDYKADTFEHEDLLMSDEMFKKGLGGGIDNLRFIGNHFYTIDTGNELYRREDRHKWTLLTPDAKEYAQKFATTSDDDEYGIYSGDVGGLDGYSEDEIYFGGDKANLWYFDGKESHKIFHLPKEGANFEDVLCCEDGKVYAIDHNGRGVAVGRHNNFAYIPMQKDDPVKGTLIYDAAHYNGKIYAANGNLMVFDGKRWHDAGIKGVYGNVEHLAAKDGMLFIATPWSLHIYNGKESITLYGEERADAKLILDSFLDAGIGLIESSNALLDTVDTMQR